MSEQVDYFFAVLDADLQRAKRDKTPIKDVIYSVFESYAAVFHEYEEGKEEESKPKVKPEDQDQYDTLEKCVVYVREKIDQYKKDIDNIHEIVWKDIINTVKMRFNCDEKVIKEILESMDITNTVIIKKDTLIKSSLELLELQNQLQQKMKILEKRG